MIAIETWDWSGEGGELLCRIERGDPMADEGTKITDAPGDFTTPLAIDLPPGLKAGWRSTEFWVTLLAMAFAIFLASRGCEGLATALFAVAGVGYKASRTILKLVAKPAAVLLVFLALGCSTPGRIDVDALKDTLRGVCSRHDAYTKADAGIDDWRRVANLRDTELLRKLVDEAEKAKHPDAAPVASK